MVVQTAQDLRPAPPAPRFGLRRRIILAVAAAVALLVGFEAGIRMIPPDAVQVMASSAASAKSLATREVGDARTVAGLYARINSLPSDGLLARGGCTLPGPDAVTYTFRFTRWGLPVEVATLPGDGCYRWRMSRGGLPELAPRVAPDDQAQAIVSDAQAILAGS